MKSSRTFFQKKIDLTTTLRLFKYFSQDPNLAKDLRVLYNLLRPHSLTGLEIEIQATNKEFNFFKLLKNSQFKLGNVNDNSKLIVKSFEQDFYKTTFKFYCTRPYSLKRIIESPTAIFLRPLLEKRFMYELSKQQTMLWRKIFDSIHSPHIIIDHDYNVIKLNAGAGKISKVGLKNSKGQKCYSVLARRSRPCRNCPILTPGLKTIRFDKPYIALSFAMENQKAYGIYYLSIEEELQLLQEYISKFKLQKLGQSFDLHLEDILFPLKNIQNITTGPTAPHENNDLMKFNYSLSRAFSVIENMITFLNPNTLSFSSDTCLLSHAVEKTLNISRPHLHNILVDSNLSQFSELQIPGNLNLWIQIFFNLIKNAFQAMPKGGKIQITYETSAVTIRDTGTGISQHQLENLFVPLFSTKKNHGSGLGLFIVKRLLERLECKIEVKSKLGQGTEFIIYFPILEKKIDLNYEHP